MLGLATAVIVLWTHAAIASASTDSSSVRTCVSSDEAACFPKELLLHDGAQEYFSALQIKLQDLISQPKPVMFVVIVAFLIASMIGAAAVKFSSSSEDKGNSTQSQPNVFETQPKTSLMSELQRSDSLQRTNSLQRSNSFNNDGTSSPSAQRILRPRLMRRHTITVAEIQDKRWRISDAEGTMGPISFVVNMFADLCPPGLLPLAYGMKNTGFVPAAILLVVFYGLCVYTMWAIGQTARLTGANTFQSQWEAAIGVRSSWIPPAVVALVCFGCNLSYACFYADIFTGVMPWLGLDMPRWLTVILFTLFPTLPLCLLKDLSALAPSSAFAVVSVLFCAVIMCLRATDGSYEKGGYFYKDLAPTLRPQVPENHLWDFGLSSLALVNMLAMAFLTHYNGCKYYRELKSHNPTFFRRCTAIGMGICVSLFAVICTATYKTFGSAADGMILKNYSRNDALINVARIGMGFSIVASFPLMFSGLREAVITCLNLFFPDGPLDTELVLTQNILSLVLLTLVVGCAVVLTDAGVVVGVVGAVCGNAVIYIIPCLLYASSIRLMQGGAGHMLEVSFQGFLIVLGACLAIGGLKSALSS